MFQLSIAVSKQAQNLIGQNTHFGLVPMILWLEHLYRAQQDDLFLLHSVWGCSWDASHDPVWPVHSLADTSVLHHGACSSKHFLIFPGDSEGKESACSVGDPGSVPG